MTVEERLKEAFKELKTLNIIARRDESKCERCEADLMYETHNRASDTELDGIIWYPSLDTPQIYFQSLGINLWTHLIIEEVIRIFKLHNLNVSWSGTAVSCIIVNGLKFECPECGIEYEIEDQMDECPCNYVCSICHTEHSYTDDAHYCCSEETEELK